MSKEKQIDCIHYDKELDCCKELSDWSDPMPVLQPCVEGACPKYESDKQIEEMAEALRHTCEGECFTNVDGLIDCEVCRACYFYEAGYRKQSDNLIVVVRCCDCKYCEVVIDSIIDEPKYFCTRMVGSIPIDPTDYCSRAVKKVGE